MSFWEKRVWKLGNQLIQRLSLGQNVFCQVIWTCRFILALEEHGIKRECEREIEWEREKERGSEKERPTERDIQAQIGKTEG